MLPFERLRYLARYSGDERALVEEAADCLADFDDAHAFHTEQGNTHTLADLDDTTVTCAGV